MASDYELVPYDITERTKYVERLCENICEQVNRDIVHGYEGPSPKTEQILRDYCKERGILFRSYSPGEYDRAVHQSLVNLLTNFYIEDHNLAQLMSKIDMNAFYEKERKKLGEHADLAFEYSSGLAYVIQHKDAFFEEVEAQLGVPADDLEWISKRGSLPEIKLPHTPGVYLEKSDNTGDIAILLYAYTIALKTPKETEAELDEDPLKWWKDLCKEAEQLAIERYSPEPDMDMGM